MFKETAIKFVKSDAGRSNYFKGEKAGDCVVRAIAHATGKDYKEIYDDIFSLAKNWGKSKTKKNLKIRENASPRNGVNKVVLKYYIEDVLKFTWVSCSGIGKGITVHLKRSELPKGNIILKVSKHLTCVKDGVLFDTYDCSRNGERGVYGYWIKKDDKKGILKCLNDLAAYYETCGTEEDWDNFGTICKKLKVLTIFDESHKLFNLENNN